MNKFELIRPKSIDDSVYAEFEYLLRWVGRDGSDYTYMFYDAEFQKKVDTAVINRESTTIIKSLITRVGNTINLTANDLSLNDSEIVAQIFENQVVRRINIDGTETKLAPASGSFKSRLMDGRYIVNFTLVKTDAKSWR